ncbi:MAG: LLM class flavin-dependent oxidoreductase [Candidatus Nanopelagicales bacterium]
MTTLGVVFLPQLPPSRLRAVAQAADAAGLEELWLWEDCFRESGVATAAAALAWTDRLRLGIGLLPVPLRNVALTAMEVATLGELFPGRVSVGLGHGVQDWMAQVGARVESPLTLLREHLINLAALLGGDEVTSAGRYVSLNRVRLDWPPTTPPMLLAGATGPKTLRLSGSLADGTIITASTSPDGVRDAVARINEGRASAARNRPHAVVVYVLAATGPGAQERIDRAQRESRDDLDRQCRAAGDADDVARAVTRWADAGATTVVLQPTPDDPDPEGFVRFVAQEVRPLVA